MSKEEIAEEMHLYVQAEKDGAIQVPTEIGDLMLSIEKLIEEESVDEYDKGTYFALTEFLSTPAVYILEKAKELLLDIIDENAEKEDDDEEDDNEKESIEEAIIELPENDISDEALEQELALLEKQSAQIPPEWE